ncbi:metallophosphoesterase family protein [Asticcacaulis solisilvae]|uniref:metallophosphoesterase family protein n=1 Tax=Asticcacaulis solisilvae TaxID=1217274 RepID=UPI003FD74654
MLAALKSFLKPSESVRPSTIGRLTYAIGDIHGRDDLFARMIERIEADSALQGERPVIVLLGDYVDRGAASAEVLDRILRLEQADWCDVVVLLGNHEETLLNFLSDSSCGPAWVEYGAGATLASYGVQTPAMRTDPEAWEQVREELVAAIPPAHVDLLRRMRLTYRDGDYFFVHAGVRPDVPLEAQGAEDFLWIRGAFLQAKRACDYVVVHGHTPAEAPANDRWRVGLDTGAYATGTLTAMRFKGESRFVMDVRV